METTKVANDEIEIDLKEFFMVLWSKKFIIILIGCILALGGWAYSSFVTVDIYQSSTRVYIINNEGIDKLTTSDFQMSTIMTQDFKELVVSKPVIEEVIGELNLDGYSYKTLAPLVSVSIPEDTRILKISVSNADPYLARDIANAVRDSAAVFITDVMNLSAVNLVEEANLPDAPINANAKRNIVICGAIGIFLSSIVFLLIYFFDDTIKSPEDVEKYLGVAVLGNIPIQEKSKSKKGKRKGK